MNRLRKFRRNKEVTKKEINKIKSITLKISLILLNLIFATFAWFIYQANFRAKVDVNVSAWKVDFKHDGNSLNTLTFDVDNFYPGMDGFSKIVEITNLGERSAGITYEVQKLKILGTEYKVKNTVEEGDAENTINSNAETKDGITTVKLLNDSSKFPFEITLVYSQVLLSRKEAKANENIGSFEIYLTWPYEIEGNDDEKDLKNLLDTRWGYNIANFHQSNPNSKAIEITLKAIARQIID